MAAVPDLIWCVVPEGVPTVNRWCPRCEASRAFVSTEAFRVNGHQGRVDVWLIYQCDHCRYTWKLTIFTRVRPKTINEALYSAFMQNDPEVARRYAFDLPLIRKAGGDPNAQIPFSVVQESGPSLVSELTDFEASGARVLVELGFQAPVTVRFSQLLAKMLPLSRSAAGRLLESGGLEVPGRKKLPKKISEPLCFWLDLERLRALLD